MNFRIVYYSLLLTLLSFSPVFAAEPKLTLYLPFDGNTNAQIASGNSQVKFGKDETPQFADGISGTGLVCGGSDQGVRIEAPGNISPDQWTITFWIKGLPDAAWNDGKHFEGFWGLEGQNGGMMWFYHYQGQPAPWLYSRRDKTDDYQHMYASKAAEKEWHYWAVSWRKGTGAYLYLDGQLVGQSPCQPPNPVRYITVGQPANPASPPTSNKIIDEFKIYDTALEAGSIARRYWQEGNFALLPTLTVAPSKQKITIDGRIGAEEWKNTTGFSGFIDAQSWSQEAPSTQGKMTYDDHNLYLAIRSDNPAEIKDKLDTTALYGFVKKDAVRHDGEVQKDDNFFFQFMPSTSGQNVYTLSANGIDTVYDALTDATGKIDSSWESKAQVKSAVGIEGWTLEAAIPLKSLGLENIADGTSWRMNFGRVWKMLRQRTDLWSPGQRVKELPLTPVSGLGIVNFTGTPDAVVSLQRFAAGQDGKVDALLHLFNPGTTAHELTVSLTASDKVLQQQKVLLQPGNTQTVALEATPQNADGALISISVQSGTDVLFRQSTPLIIERAGQLTLWSYPSLQQIRLGWTIQSSSDPQTLRLDALVKDATGKGVQTVALDRLSSLNDSTLVDVKPLAPGKYTVDVQVKSGQSVLQQQILLYNKEPLPSWLGNSLGISDAPPPPWTDVKVDNARDAVSIWGRTYDYDRHLLPTQIINQDKPMLTAPMRLIVQAAGVQLKPSDSTKARVQWTKTTTKRADSLRSQVLGQVDVTADSYTEFDGMTWMNLTLTPQTAKTNVNELTLELPLKAEWAALIRPYDDYRLQQTGALLDKGWKGPASSMPWIGNGSGGIQVFQESTVTWIGSKSIEIIPTGEGTVTVRVHLIDQTAVVDKPLHFALGWIASPVKPAPRNNRDWRLFNGGSILSDPQGARPVGAYLLHSATVNPGIQPYFPWWQDWWQLPPEYKGNPDLAGVLPVPRDNLQNKGIHDYHGIEIPFAAYSRLTGLVGTANPWFAQFGDEWVTSTAKFTPDTTLSAAQQSATVSQASSSLRDYYLWGFNQLLTRSKTKALYFDVSRPVNDTNIYHGAGTVMPDGSIEPSRNILGMRKAFERIYTLMKATHSDGQVFYHMSGEVMLPIYSFCDAMIDGENYAGLLDRKNNRGYENVLTLDQFRAEYSAQNNFGPATVFLAQFERAKSITPSEWKTLGYQHADYLLGLIFLHDSNLWWAWMPEEHLAQVYTAIDATGRNSDWEFIPYWQQQYFSLPPGVNASIYHAPDRQKALLILMNTSGKDQQIDLHLSLKQETFTTAQMIYPALPLSAQNGRINALTLPNNNFRAVLLEK